MGQFIELELCKKPKFYKTIKLYIHKPESVHENEMDKIILDIDVRTYHPVQTIRSYPTLINKKKKFLYIDNGIWITFLKI